jgi:phosphonate transport system substrate-binding protein
MQPSQSAPVSSSHSNARRTVLTVLAGAALAFAFTRATLAQKPPPAKAAADNAITLAINEGAAGNVDAFEILLRYEKFKLVCERALNVPVRVVAVRDAKVLRRSTETAAFSLILSRPVDALAEAVRDHGYQPVVVAREIGHALFIVPKDSPLKSIEEIRGKRIVTPDEYSYMWRIANAMLRDNKVQLTGENVRAMRDQAAIGWSMENGFFDVGVVASYSGVGRNWEKNGGRVIAKSRDLMITPIIASPKVAASDVAKLRAALIGLAATDGGPAILKEIGVSGFKEADAAPFLDLLTWLGELPKPKPQSG